MPGLRASAWFDCARFKDRMAEEGISETLAAHSHAVALS
jgi:hypothetical protein